MLDVTHSLFMMKYKILNGSLAVAVGVAALFISSCGTVPYAVPTPVITMNADEEAKKYNLALVDAIQNADKLVIKEHSHKIDFFGTIPGLNNTPQYIYAQKELSPGEKILFLENVKNLDEYIDRVGEMIHRKKGMAKLDLMTIKE